MKKLLCLLSFFPILVGAESIGGLSIAALAPTGDFAESHTAGLGVYGNFEYQFAEKAAFTAELGHAQWAAEDEEGNDVVNEDIRTFSAVVGLNYRFLGPLYVEGRTGYYFSDLNEVVLIPALGVRLGKFDLNMGANVLDPHPFLVVRVGFFWLK